jgi:hypothetical protein
MKPAYSTLVFTAAVTIATSGLFAAAHAGTPVRHGDSVAVDAGGVQEQEVKSPRDAASGQATGKRVAVGDVDADGASGAETRAQDHNSSRSNKTASSVGTEPCCADTDGDGTADKTKLKETQPQIYKAKQGTTGKAK